MVPHKSVQAERLTQDEVVKDQTATRDHFAKNHEVSATSSGSSMCRSETVLIFIDYSPYFIFGLLNFRSCRFKITGHFAQHSLVGRFARKSCKAAFEVIELRVRKIFQVKQFIAGALAHPDQFIELEMERRAVAVLCILDEKHHQKSNNGGSCVDDQLPGVRVVKQRTSDRPDHDCKARDGKGGRPATLARCPLRDGVEG